MAVNPETTSGTPGSPPPYALPEFQSFAGAPMGAYTDAQYLADEADLRNTISSQYSDLLSQLGYVDPSTGAFIPGSVQQNADLQEANQRQAMQQADLAVDQNAQNSGILFSGVRGTQRAQAETPMLQALGQIELQTPQTLADLYRQAGSLIGTYNTKNAQLLAAAAGRATDTINKNPTTPATTTVTPPPAPVDTGTGGNIPTAQPPVGGGSNPNRGYAMGGEIEQPTNAVMGENATPGDPSSHEVVVPRRGLLPHENAILSNLAHAARLRLAQGAMPPHGIVPIPPMTDEPPGSIIHALTPASAVPTPAIEHAITGSQPRPADMLAASGDTDAATELWLQHHPGLIHGHASNIPSYVLDALSRRMSMAPGAGAGGDLGSLPPIHVHVHAPHPGIPNPGMEQ